MYPTCPMAVQPGNPDPSKQPGDLSDWHPMLRGSEGDLLDDLLQRIHYAEASVTRLNREVEHLQRLAMIGTLSTSIIHEINNLLTPALCRAQIAHLHLDDPQQIKAGLEQCVLSITQASRVAETLMALAIPSREMDSRTTASQSQSHMPSANVARCFQAAVVCLAGEPHRVGITIDSDVPPDTWARIEPVALQQVFLNLLLNAVRALRGQRNPLIRITAEPVGVGQVEIIFEDNGPGIPEAIRSQAFEPFVTAGQGGTGLGLPVTKRLIKQAGGSIEVTKQQRAGKSGARFTIRLASITHSSASNMR